MLDKNRIKEAESNVKRYLEEGLLHKVVVKNDNVFRTFVRNYQESLNVAKILYEKNYSYLWTIVISYYSMYYITTAVIYKHGYKVGDKIVHKVTADALISFIRDKIKKKLIEGYEEQKDEALEIIGKRVDSLLYYYEKEMNKRARMQYQTTEEIKKAKANTSLERARNFAFEMEKLL